MDNPFSILNVSDVVRCRRLRSSFRLAIEDGTPQGHVLQIALVCIRIPITLTITNHISFTLRPLVTDEGSILSGDSICSGRNLFITRIPVIMILVANQFASGRVILKIHSIDIALIIDIHDRGTVTGNGHFPNWLCSKTIIGLGSSGHNGAGGSGLLLRLLKGVAIIIGIFLPMDDCVNRLGIGCPLGIHGGLLRQSGTKGEGGCAAFVRKPAAKGVAQPSGICGLECGVAAQEELRGNGAAASRLESQPDAAFNHGIQVYVALLQGHGFDNRTVPRPAGDGHGDRVIVGGLHHDVGVGFAQIGHHISLNAFHGIGHGAIPIVEEDVSHFLESGIYIDRSIRIDRSYRAEGSRLIANDPASKLVAFHERCLRLVQGVALLHDLGLTILFAVHAEDIGNARLLMNVEILRAVGEELLHKGAVGEFIESAGGALVLEAVIRGADAFQALVVAAIIELAEGAGGALVLQTAFVRAGAFQILVEGAGGDVALGAEGALPFQAFLRGADTCGLFLDLRVGHPDGHFAGGLGPGDGRLILAAPHVGHVGHGAGNLVAGDGGEINLQDLGGLALVKGHGHIVDGRDGAVGAHHELHGDGDGSGGLLLFLTLAGGDVLGADGAVRVLLFLGAALLAGAGLLLYFLLGLCLGAGAAGSAHGAVGVGSLRGAGSVTGAGLFFLGLDLVPGVPTVFDFGRGLRGSGHGRGLRGSGRGRGLRGSGRGRGLRGSGSGRGLRGRGLRRSGRGCRIRGRCRIRGGGGLRNSLRHSLLALGKHRHREHRVEHAQAQKQGHHSLKHLYILLVSIALSQTCYTVLKGDYFSRRSSIMVISSRTLRKVASTPFSGQRRRPCQL